MTRFHHWQALVGLAFAVAAIGIFSLALPPIMTTFASFSGVLHQWQR